MKAARRPIAITSDIIVGFPGETEADFEATLGLLMEVEYDSVFAFKYSRRPNTPALALEDQIPEEEKVRRLAIVQEHQRQIQIRRNAAYVGAVEECLVEGFNKATGQWIGRTSQFKTLNFLHPTAGDGSLGQSGSAGQGGSTGQNSLLGQYVDVRVTRSGANSLAGEYAG